METLVIVSKIKKFIKEQAGFNTASNVAEALSKFVAQACEEAAAQTRKAGRKTIMDRDFMFYDESSQPKETLVVASKVKKFIKEKFELSTSANVIQQLTLAVEDLCKKAIHEATSERRKTVMDRDFNF